MPNKHPRFFVIIAIDYDETYTADTEFWLDVIKLGKSRGHKFICVTARTHKDGMCDLLKSQCEIFCTNGLPKIQALYDMGQRLPQVWIEDMSHLLFAEGQVELPECY